jgi:hypothetical protein
MDEGCDTLAPEWHRCYPVHVHALVAAGVATATAGTPFYEEQQIGAAGPDFSLSASPWRAPRDKWSEAACGSCEDTGTDISQKRLSRMDPKVPRSHQRPTAKINIAARTTRTA